MASEETLSPAPPLFPLGRVAPIRALADMYPRAVSNEEKGRIQLIIDEEIALIGGADGKPGENPQVKRHMDLMSAHFDIGNGLNIPSLRVGMITLYHTARFRGDALGTPVPTVSKGQLENYFEPKEIAIEEETLIQYGSAHAWNEIMAQFQTDEPGFMSILKSKGRSTHPTHVSFEFGIALMWDFLKTAPTLQPVKK